jgi:hypothetical protein
LSEVFDEYAGYHMLNGKVVKIDDDLLSAIRVGCMDLRYAKTMSEFPTFLRAGAIPQIADGTDFDLFTGE